MKKKEKEVKIPKVKQGARNNIDPITGLSPNEELFVQKYMETNNGTQSAIYAGYSKKTAASKGSQLLKQVNIRSEIQKRQKELVEKTGKGSIATAQQVMEYFTKVMNGEILDQFGLEAPLQERTKAAVELAKRTVDIENRANGKADAVVEIKLDWSRDS